MKRKITIGIDIDQVLARLNEQWLNVIREKEGEDVKPEMITDWHMAKFFKCGEKIYDYLDYDLFRHLPVMEHAKEVVKELCEFYHVYVVTSATSKPEIMVAKWEWLEEHFPFISKEQIIMCGDKSQIATDVLIDDAPHNLEDFKGSIRVLFDQPYNRNEDRFIRARDWKHIRTMFLG